LPSSIGNTSRIQIMSMPIVLYVPNLICYARILLAFGGLHCSNSSPVWAVSCWITAAILDLFDGLLARKLNQCSTLGILVDVAADNILRTVVWLSAAIQDPSSYSFVAVFCICLEWLTMACTQLHAVQSESHWKLSRERDPWLVRRIFANNFKTFFGGLCIYGLFFVSIFAYASHHPIFADNILFYDFWKYAAYCGRGFTALAELWLCKSYLSLLVEKDMNERKNNK
jgi:phosphatidylglycerophosphate synthase